MVHTPNGKIRWLKLAPRFINEAETPGKSGFEIEVHDITSYKQQQAVNEAAKQINQRLIPKKILSNIQAILSTVLPHDRANIIFNENGKWVMQLKWEYEEASIPVLKMGSEVFDVNNRPTLSWMKQYMQPLAIANTLTDKRYENGNTGSFVAAPLVAKDQKTGENIVLGFLQLNSNSPNLYSEEDAQLLMSFAEHTAIAINNAREAAKDSLTNLWSNAHFKEHMYEETRRAIRAGSPISFLMMDSDHFKSVNDTYGHILGDKMIWAHSYLLRKIARQADIIGRWGGEEYAIILPGADKVQATTFAQYTCAIADYVLPKVLNNLVTTQNLSLDNVKEIADIIDNALIQFPRQTHPNGEGIPRKKEDEVRPPGTTFSIGIFSYKQRDSNLSKEGMPDSDSIANMIMNYADKAAYSAKLEGRNRVSDDFLHNQPDKDFLHDLSED